MKTRLTLTLAVLLAAVAMPNSASAATIEGARIDNMACDNFYFNIVAGPKTVRIDKFAVYAYHTEQTKYYVYYHPGEFAGTENDAAAWTLVSTTSVKPTGWDTTFELSAGGTFVAAGETGAFMICADLANDNGALWGGADGELVNGDLMVSLGRWLTRLNETKPKHFVTSGQCSDSHGFGGVVTYTVVADAKAPKITSAPPATLAITEGGQLHLEVVVEGTGPFTYQWKRGGSAIDGATGAVYQKIAQLTDAASYSVTVTGPVAPPATSGGTAVTVNPDQTAPTIAAVSSDGPLTNIVVRFSEPMDPVEAVKTQYYQVAGVSISGAEISEDGTEVTLATSRLQSYTAYILVAGGVPDRAAAKNKLAAGTRAPFATPAFALASPTTGNIFTGFDNTYFNVTAGAKDVTILSWAPVAFHGADTDYLLFTHPGDYAGTEATSNAWTLVASNRFAASAIPIPRPITGAKVRIPAGQMQAFLMTIVPGGGNLYPGAGEILADDFTLSLGKNFARTGEGIFDVADSTGEPGFAGTIEYCFESCQALAIQPTLKIARQGNEVVLSWTATGFTLQSSPTLISTGWTDSGSASPVNVPIGPGSQFFRLIKR